MRKVFRVFHDYPSIVNGNVQARCWGVAIFDRARQLTASAKRITALTGAGISTDSGIPDFRGPKGVWTTNPGAEKTATLRHYLAEPEVRRAAWRNRLDSPTWSAEPNAGHRALVALEQQGRLRAVVTQNIDELHQRAGSTPELVVELHGTMRSVVCWGCGERQPMERALERLWAGEDDPHCLTCGGILKSDTISFGQALDPLVLAAAESAVAECDLLLAIGSSLTVYPAAGLVPLAKRIGAAVIIINAQPTPFDDMADAVLRGPIGALLPALV
jgi:NAD-dependent deacetylase